MHTALITSSGKPFSVEWSAWEPVDTAVLTFIRHDGQVLLILKKRGLGHGKFNAPGGRLEAGETPEQAAVRETQEEVGLTPQGLRFAGRLDFAFTDGYSLRCHVFTASSYVGVLAETDEAAPFWCNETALPYARMWADDRLWIPLMLDGRRFEGRFVFEGDAMLWRQLESGDACRCSDGNQPRGLP